MNCLPLNIHFEFDNLFNENKFATKRADFLLVPISLHLALEPPTEWIISTLPQRTHYTQLLLTVCIPISIDIPDLVFPLVSSHTHLSLHSSISRLHLRNMMNGTTLSFSLRLHLFWKLRVLCSDWVCNY